MENTPIEIINAEKVIEFAKQNGFPNAEPIYWDYDNPEIGHRSIDDMIECDEPGQIKFNVGIHLDSKPISAEVFINEEDDPDIKYTPESCKIASHCYVLVYVGDEGEWQFFKDQNLYLGVANLTDSVEHAAMMTLDEAEGKWGCMTVKADWQIWSVRTGIVLDAMSDRHMIRAKKAALEAELKSLPPCT